MRLKIYLRACLLALLPTNIVRPLVNQMGFQLEKGARVGFSLLAIDALKMSATSRVGHANRIMGPFAIELAEHGAIGHGNTMTRAPIGVSVGRSTLTIGVWGKVTSRHFLDLTCPISIGDYSTIAGSGSQIWTHGYVHATQGIDRYRIDGSVIIGNNVYIGSMTFISMGVRIADGVIVGGGSAVAKDLLEPGLYVSSMLRQLPRPPEPDTRADLMPVDRSLSEDRVYVKRTLAD
jgi:acetyltransferase-like isoleucine patch superfamily enzyme